MPDVLGIISTGCCAAMVEITDAKLKGSSVEWVGYGKTGGRRCDRHNKG